MMIFNNDVFAATLKQYNPDQLMVYSGWESAGATAQPNDIKIEYNYLDTGGLSNTTYFRTWLQETSIPGVQTANANEGLFVSCKIDYEAPDKQPDDHIIIMQGFILVDNKPKLCFAQIIIDYANAESNNMRNFNTGAITDSNITDGNSISDHIFDLITTQLSQLPINVKPDPGYGPQVPAPVAWQYFPYIVKANMDSITAAVSSNATGA